MNVHRESEVGEDLGSATDAADPTPFLDFDPVGHMIYPCDRCSSWWAQVVHQDSGRLVVREWHDLRCPFLVELR